MKPFLKTAVRCGTVALAAATLLPLVAQAQAPTPFGAVPNARQIEWFHREQQVFLHFGVNTFTNAEWGSGNEDPKIYNPTALDCGQWMRVIRSGCFTSAIFVAKHHDGFCQWPSEYTTFDVASSNWRGGNGDLVKEFADSCRAYGIKPAIYLSVGDFHTEKLGNYTAYYRNQTIEICKKYGTIWEMWWDGANAGMSATDMKMMADTIHALQPNCVVWSDAAGKNVCAEARWIGNEGGNGSDPCWATENDGFTSLGNGILGGSIYCPAEVNSSDRPGWFWHADQNNSVQSVDVMWNKYFQSVGRNATWLYNLPPDNRGLIYKTDSINIDAVGAFIYGTFKAPHANLAEGATVTAKNPRGAGYEPANLVDTAEATYYATPNNINTDTIIFDLGSAKSFDCLMLREVIQLGHRTTGWSVDYSSDNSSYTSLLANKQSIGYKWLEKFNQVTARYVRLKITKGQACVALNTFGVYKKTSVKPPPFDPTGVAAPVVKTVPLPLFTFQVFGRSVELPKAFVRGSFTAELLDLQGRTVATTMVDAKRPQTETRAPAAGTGFYLIKCAIGNDVVVRKFAVAAK
jgi:alpha-L-fucosidase